MIVNGAGKTVGIHGHCVQIKAQIEATSSDLHSPQLPIRDTQVSARSSAG
ncbi:hypothetical protein [Aestuariivirga sp.]|nr:hypothetical protein [Aestuariivirga sp.]MCA3555591.1 hypothetical protein [Aestuariivirga sp.]